MQQLNRWQQRLMQPEKTTSTLSKNINHSGQTCHQNNVDVITDLVFAIADTLTYRGRQQETCHDTEWDATLRQRFDWLENKAQTIAKHSLKLMVYTCPMQSRNMKEKVMLLPLRCETHNQHTWETTRDHRKIVALSMHVRSKKTTLAMTTLHCSA